MKLSKRLEMVASFVKEGSNLADIGTDHGYIPIALAERGQVKRAIAMDVRSGPLERAKEHIKLHRLEDRIETRLSDGTKMLEPGEADTVVISGMGGDLVIHILEEGRFLWDSVSQWVLSPQSELDKVRRFLEGNGFVTVREDMVEEDGKYYTVMDVVWQAPPFGEKCADRKENGLEIRGCHEFSTDLEDRNGIGREAALRNERFTRQDTARDVKQKLKREAGYLYGRLLIREKNPVLKEFLQREELQLERIREQLKKTDSQAANKRLAELEWELEIIKEAQDEMQ